MSVIGLTLYRVVSCDIADWWVESMQYDNIPHTNSAYRVDPRADLAEGSRRIAQFIEVVERRSVSGIDEDVVPDVIGLVAELDCGATMPKDLELLLHEMSESGLENSDIIGLLTRMYRIAVYGPENACGVGMSIECRTFARAILLRLREVCAEAVNESAEHIWRDFCDYTTSVPDSSLSSKTIAARGVAHRIGLPIRRLNTPSTYVVLAAYLRHSWPEVRHRGAIHLKTWRAPKLSGELLAALERGVGEACPFSALSAIIDRLVDIGGDQVASGLVRLQSQAIDPSPFSRAIHLIIARQELNN